MTLAGRTCLAEVVAVEGREAGTECSLGPSAILSTLMSMVMVCWLQLLQLMYCGGDCWWWLICARIVLKVENILCCTVAGRRVGRRIGCEDPESHTRTVGDLVTILGPSGIGTRTSSDCCRHGSMSHLMVCLGSAVGSARYLEDSRCWELAWTGQRNARGFMPKSQMDLPTWKEVELILSAALENAVFVVPRPFIAPSLPAQPSFQVLIQPHPLQTSWYILRTEHLGLST